MKKNNKRNIDERYAIVEFICFHVRCFCPPGCFLSNKNVLQGGHVVKNWDMDAMWGQNSKLQT